MAGPLSISLVSFSQEALTTILKGSILSSLNDSKLLSPKKREFVYFEIKKYAKVALLQFVSNKFIDNYGLTYSIYYGLKKLVVKSGLKNPYLLIDGNYNFSRFDKNLSYKSIVKGDSKIASIAAASIIAKVNRDWFMQKMSSKFPEYEFEKHKGYGTKVHIKNIEKFGYCRIHRKTFVIKKGTKNWEQESIK